MIMIKKLTLISLVLSLVLNAQALIRPVSTQIISISKDSATINGASSIPLGSTGIVIHNFDGTHQAIVAKATMVKKDGDRGIIKLSKYDNLEQDALPSYQADIKSGDTVIMNYLYNRALAITPNSETYQTVTRSYPYLEWVHPDLFAANLATSYDPSPDKEDFVKECKEDDIGLLMFAIDKKGYFVDCNSFKVVDTIPLPTASSKQIPFYNRLEKIKGRIFGLFGSKSMKDYDSYYKKLLGISK